MKAKVELGQPGRIQPLCWRRGREDAVPDGLSLSLIREGELHDETDAPGKGGVQCVFQIRGQDSQPAVSLHAP